MNHFENLEKELNNFKINFNSKEFQELKNKIDCLKLEEKTEDN